ncbi:DUF1611 domain-containing protein [Paenibacillus sp. FSL F4-0125]|uniref:DUF1611 domain-containing protein n=1 Tax=Paenibacillus sp. FSL F4-0125 TaxID=2954730 RepID=UPI0030F870DA
MKKVAVYPFNKITQGLIRFRDLLDVEIVSVIDFVFQAGCDAGELVDGTLSDIFIYASQEEGLAGVDTLILNDPGTSFGGNKGIFDENDLTGLWRKLVTYAVLRGIRVISVHDIYEQDTLSWMKENQIKIEVIHGSRDNLFKDMDARYGTEGSNTERYLKQFENEALMFSIPKKIKRIGIFATRGCIGKFTLQMKLFKEFKKNDIPVTAFITEPTGFLFGQPEGDIFKFLAQRPLEQYPYYIDTVVDHSERNGNEWIIMAGQSSILPTSNIAFNSLRFAMLKSFNPDHVLLIVGFNDDEQIRDAIEILRIYSKRPISLLLPDKIESSYGQYEAYPYERRIARKVELQQKFLIHVYLIEEAADVMNLLLEAENASSIAGRGK